MNSKILVFVYSNFSYCRLVWYFSSAKSLEKKLKRFAELALRFLYNGHRSSYSELPAKSERCTMHVSGLRVLCIEVFKTLKHLNPPFMGDVFKIRDLS